MKLFIEDSNTLSNSILALIDFVIDKKNQTWLKFGRVSDVRFKLCQAEKPSSHGFNGSVNIPEN